MSNGSLNNLRQLMYFPGLKPTDDIVRAAFYRRKPKGFSNGHYLQFNPQTYASSPNLKRNMTLFFGGTFFFFWGVLGMHQVKKGKLFANYVHEPAYFKEGTRH